MKVTQNIGILNALWRITCGLTMLGWATARMTRYPRRTSYLFIAMLAAMKVGEGIVRYCPFTALYEEGKVKSAIKGVGNEISQAIDFFQDQS